MKKVEKRKTMKEETTKNERIGNWAILELNGFKKLAGFVTEEEHFGTMMGRIDVPLREGGMVTMYFGASAVYRLTVCSEEIARAEAKNPGTFSTARYELPMPSFQKSYFDDQDTEDDDELPF